MRTGPEVATFFGLSYDHVRKQEWFRGYAKEKKGYYLPEIADRRHKQAMGADQSVSEDGGVKASLSKVRIREIEQNVRAKTRLNDLEESNLLESDKVEQAIVHWAIRFRTPLFQLGDKIAARVPGRMKASIKHEVREVVRNALTMVLDMEVGGKDVERMILEEARRISAARNRRNDGAGI